MDLVTDLRKAAEHGLIDCPIKIKIKRGASSVAPGRRPLARADRTRWGLPLAPHVP